MILDYMQRGLGAGAWVIGFLCMLALPVGLIGLLVTVLAGVFGASEEEDEESADE